MIIGHKGGEKTRKQAITTKTFIPLILLSLIIIFGVNTVSANEIYVNTTGNDTSGTGSADNPYLTIQKGVDKLDPNGVINIADGQYSGLNNTKITINKNMTIIGQNQTGTIINGTDTYWIFIINKGITVTLENLTLSNGYTTTYGGAIYNRGNLTVTNCTFYQNRAGYSGGAIYNEGNLTVTNCTFYQNRADYSGGAVENDCIGSDSIICTVTESTFNQNRAAHSGGAVENYCIGSGSMICTVTESTFNQNRAGHSGGAVENDCIDSSVICTVTESTFNKNQASSGGAVGNYCVSNGSVICTVTESTFNRNYGWNIGTISNECNNKGYVICAVTNCTFNQNHAEYGGVVQNYCTDGAFVICTVNESTFDQNYANWYGGVIYNGCKKGSLTCTVIESIFNQNQAARGGVVYNGDFTGNCITFTVIKSVFKKNEAALGGVIYNNYADGFLNCTAHFNRFYNNQASLYGNAIYNDGGYVDATLNWWGSNEDPSSQFYGSNILYDPWIVLTINADPATIYNTQRSTITANLLYDSRSLTDPNNPAYYHAPELGCVPDTPVTFDADSLGDLTPSKPHNTTVPSGQNVTVVFTALNSGVSEVNATVDDETVKTSINIIPQIEDVYVATAADGGSDSNDGSSSNPFLTLEKAINAVIAGGRIHIANGVYKDPLDRGLILTKNMTIFQDNWITGTGTSVIIDADSDGRIFLIDSGATVTLQNITMVNSTGFDGVGGAILNLGTLNVLNCRFSDNEADYYGGAIYNYGDLSVYNSIFTENLVSDWSEYFVGGAICNMANMNVTNCTFTHNTAGTGGAISSQTDPGYTMIITGNMFTGNSATNYGGAFYIYNGDYTSNIIQFNRIVGNTASQGDGIYTDHGSVNATLNWWGSNTDPSTISNLFVAVSGGSVVSDPWLVLRTCADPDSIYNGQTSTVTANLLYDSGILTDRDHSERYYHNPANGHVPDGIPVIFNLIDGPLGTLTSQTTFLNGAASIIFTATHIGIQHVNATIDYENATSTINIDPIGHVNITKNADNYAPDYWSLVTFTVNAYNEGPNDVEGLQITDLIPSGLTIISSNTHGFGTYSAGLWNIGTLTNGTTAILTLVVNATSTGTFTNWANVTTQTTHDISTWSKDNATITVPAATYLTISKQFQDLPWGNVITTAYYNDKIYAIVKVHNQGPDSTSSVDVLDRLDGFTWTGNYYVYRTVGSYPNTESAWVLNDQDYPFNGTNWNVGALSTMIGSERWLAIELVVNQTGTVSNYAETVNQSTYPYKGYDNDTTYLTANITPTNINMGDVRGDKGDTVTFKAVLTDYQANALEGETVEFWIDGVKVGENATDSTGTARFNYVITETPGSHNLMAVFGETGLYQGCNATGELYVPTANLYIQITSDRNNPTVGEKFTVTYKLGNQGPDDADNVTIIIPIPEGFHVLNIYGDGNWTVNDNGTITWTFTTVAVGDPYLYLYGYALKGGNFLFTASIFSDTYNINSIGVTSLVLNAVPRETAATTETTFGMQNTGIPLHGMVLAILMVLGGFISNWKKQ